MVLGYVSEVVLCCIFEVFLGGIFRGAFMWYFRGGFR